MNGSLQYSALSRLLSLNNQAHDLENKMLTETVPVVPEGAELMDRMFAGNRIAEMQDQIDQVVRSSVATVWLGNANREDEEYEL